MTAAQQTASLCDDQHVSPVCLVICHQPAGLLVWLNIIRLPASSALMGLTSWTAVHYYGLRTLESLCSIVLLTLSFLLGGGGGGGGRGWVDL